MQYTVISRVLLFDHCTKRGRLKIWKHVVRDCNLRLKIAQQL